MRNEEKRSMTHGRNNEAAQNTHSSKSMFKARCGSEGSRESSSESESRAPSGNSIVDIT